MSKVSRRAAIQKATTDTTVASGGLLNDSQSRAFVEVLREEAQLGDVIRTEGRGTVEGEINKISTATRLLRKKVENADDGYRAAPTFPTVPYAAKGVKLPVEVTEEVFHRNIEGEGLEAKLLRQMVAQMAADLEDLNINGDEGSGDPFLSIDDGLLDKASTNASGDYNRIDGSTINAGAFEKAHLFAAQAALPNKYRRGGNNAPVWLMSPTKYGQYQEYLSDRATGAGDAALTGAPGAATLSPLGYEVVQVPSMPDTRVILTLKGNLVRVVTWNIRRRRVTGETDWELATRDKRGYIWFLEQDFIVETDEAVVDVHTLDA
jgi:HK97 family phage major capsid protein